MHGALGSSQIFDSFVSQLNEQYNVFRFDFRGHGEFSADELISPEILTDQIIDFIETNQLIGITIFGYSMGGYMALLASIKRPDLIGSIITLATKYVWNEDISTKEIFQLETIRVLPLEHPFKKQLVKFHEEAYYQNCINLTIHLINDLGKKKLLNNSTLSKINLPILLIIGDMDTMVSISETQEASKNLINSTIIILPNTKHPFEKVNPFELIQILNKYLKAFN